MQENFQIILEFILALGSWEILVCSGWSYSKRLRIFSSFVFKYFISAVS